MSLVPIFEIGVWNVWILSLASLFLQFGTLILLSRIYKGMYRRAEAAPQAKKIDRFVVLIMIAIFTYSVFLPLQIGSIWFYTGITIFLLGSIVVTIASVNFATTPLAEPITKGLYSYSRHPMYLAMFFEYIGMSTASASWVLLVFSMAFIILVGMEAVSEELFCLGQYGDAYREYMNRTPRWIGIPKSVKE